VCLSHGILFTREIATYLALRMFGRTDTHNFAADALAVPGDEGLVAL
jgi:hypothetical protein